MSEFLTFTLTGLGTGTTYALVGLGIALVFQVTGVINFAQGDFVMIGGLCFAALGESGLPEPMAAVLSLLITSAVGAAMNLLVIRPARRAHPERLVILTIGASITLEGLAVLVFGSDSHFAAPFSHGTPLTFGGARLPQQYLWCAAATILAMALIWFFLTQMTIGMAMRATAMDAAAARLSGISPSRMSLLAFILAAALGAVGGIVLTPLQPPDAAVGIAFGLKGFTAAVIGGLSSPVGAVIGGLAVGLIEAYTTGYLSSGYKNTVSYGLLLILLLVRPSGLVRKGSASRV